jgi:hypothetical protein
MKNTLRFLRKITPMLALAAIMMAPNWGWGQIIISQVYEGASNNKWIEITNVGSSTVDLASPVQYKLGIWTVTGDGGEGAISGAPTNSVSLEGSLAPGGIFLLKNSSASATVPHNPMPTAANSNSTVCAFNGNDALALFTGTSTIVDAFGDRINNKDISYHRNSNIVATNSTFTVSEWTTKTLAEVAAANNTQTEYIGTHIFNSGSTSIILVAPSTLTGFTYVEGSGPSAEQTFTVSGSDLTADISIAASTNYEISKTSGSGYTTPLTFTPAEAATPQTVYVRLKAGLSVGDYNNETITATSTGAVDKTVTCSGSVTAPPDAEPTNHATNFIVATGNPAFSAIDVVWDDAIGGVIPSAYLIKGSSVSYAAIVAPTDGTPETDAALVKNIAAGIQTASFTGLSENTTYYFKIFPYTNSGAAIDYKTDGTVPQDDATTAFGIPAAPVATAATAVTATGFTANWNAVAGATGYQLDIYTRTGSLTTILSENFNMFSAGTPDGGASSTDVSTSLNDYTQTAGWSGSKIYQAGGTAKMGTSSALGYIVSPEIDLSSNNGNFTIAFEAMAWSGDGTYLKIYLNDELVHTATGLNNSASYTLSPFSINLNGGTSTSKIKFEGYQASKGRFFLENLVISQGAETLTPISGSPFTTTETNKVITGLAEGTTYYYVVRATNTAGTSGNSNEIEVTTLTPSATSIYTGTGLWSNASNWSNGLPGAATDVIINGNVTVDVEAECNNMTISPTGAVTGGTTAQILYVYGDLLIESDATGTGSFIANSDNHTIGETTTVQRYISGSWSAWNSGWHQISSPVAVQPIADFATTGTGNDYDFYGWDEPTDTWMNYKAAGFSAWNGGTNFNEGQGYLVSYEAANTTQTFTGELNTADVIFVNMSNGGTSYNGWHLLGNPFASALTWNDGNWILDNVAGNAKIWHEANKSYSDIAATGIIPSAQGFMVQVSSATNGVGIPAVSRVHSATPFYKSANAQLLLVAAETEGGSAQESKIMVNPMATEGFDFDFDSRFLAGYAPQLYSVVGDEMLSTNSLPDLGSGKVIPLGFVKNAATTFTIELKESIPGTVVYLTDIQTGTVANLTETPVYSFTSDEGDDANRFSLAFGTVGISHPEATAGVQVFAHDGVLYVETPSKEVAQFSVYNLTGQLVLQGRTRGNALSTFNASALNTGVYVVNILLTDGVVSRKVVINK